MTVRKNKFKKLKSGTKQTPEFIYKVNLKVVGVGGGGSSVVNRIIPGLRGKENVEFITINTDRQALRIAKRGVKRIQIGRSLTYGRGTGMDPKIGRKAAEDGRGEIQRLFTNTDLVFIISCLGGGTGSGAFPIVAEEARKSGALVVAIVTKPFAFEGRLRRKIARQAVKNLKGKVDTLIIISNDKILELTDRKTPLYQAFGVVDKVLQQAIQGILNLLLTPGIINIDFADMKTVMREGGLALIGVGEARGEDRAVRAAKEAISSPLLDFSIKGAKGVLFDISGRDIKMLEVEKAARVITESASPEANIVFGTSRDKKLKSRIRVTVIATGLGRRRKTKKPKEKKEKAPDVKPMRKISSQIKDKIPAFIRKKMKEKGW